MVLCARYRTRFFVAELSRRVYDTVFKLNTDFCKNHEAIPALETDIIFISSEFIQHLINFYTVLLILCLKRQKKKK